VRSECVQSQMLLCSRPWRQALLQHASAAAAKVNQAKVGGWVNRQTPPLPADTHQQSEGLQLLHPRPPALALPSQPGLLASESPSQAQASA
jgi:hypothetical protein